MYRYLRDPFRARQRESEVTVVLAVRGDSGKVKPRIIYEGVPFVGGINKSGGAKKQRKNSLLYEHLPSQRTKFGYPAGSVSLGVQKSSWCDNIQCDEWITEDFMRHPEYTPFNQIPSTLVLDDFRCHKDATFRPKLQEQARTEAVMIGGGLTTVCPSMDRDINREFKHRPSTLCVQDLVKHGEGILKRRAGGWWRHG